MGRGFVSALVLAMLMMPVAAVADSWKDCMNASDRDRKIAACGEVLDTGKLSASRRRLALLHRGYARRLKGDADGAMADIEAILTDEPGHGRALYERGMLLADREEYQAAVRDLDIAVHALPDKSFVWLARGQVNIALGNPWSAAQDLTEAIRLSPDYTLAFELRAQVRCTVGRLDEALADWAEMRRTDSGAAERQAGWLADAGIVVDRANGRSEGEMAVALRAFADAGCPGL